jgi:hypothetical protein
MTKCEITHFAKILRIFGLAIVSVDIGMRGIAFRADDIFRNRKRVFMA